MASTGAATTLVPARRAVIVAAATSAAAGLVHAAAAGSHPGADELPLLFALCAALQVGWAIAAVLRVSRVTLLAGCAINGAAVTTWALSRTTGVPFVDALTEPEAVGTPDLIAAVLGGIALASTIVALVHRHSGDAPSANWVALVGVLALLLATPAMAADHSHGDGPHAHTSELAAGHSHADAATDGASHDDDGSDHDAADDGAHDEGDGHHAAPEGASAGAGAGDGHAHDASNTAVLASTGSHGHDDSDTAHASAPDAHGHDPAVPDPAHGHPDDPAAPHPPPAGSTSPPHAHPPGPSPAGPIISLDDPRVTAGQRAAAQSLISRTQAGMARFPTTEAVQAAGYASIGDGRGVGGYEHWVNWGHLVDGRELDPDRIESIVSQLQADGSKRVVSAMYILGLGKTTADIPDIAGELTTWHDHRNLCWNGNRLAGVLVNGVCPPGSTLRITPPMLHVWMVAHPCGPFAGIENHGGGCAHGH